MYKPLIEFNACLPQGFFISTDSLFGFLDIMISKNTANHPMPPAGKVRYSLMSSRRIIVIYGGDGGVSRIVAYNHDRPRFMSKSFCRNGCNLLISAIHSILLMIIPLIP